MHLYGKAVNLHAGASSALVGAMVQVFNDGGAGIDPNRGFVLVGTGRPRTCITAARR